MPKDTTITILKAIGIIAMIIGHAGAPTLLHDFIYSFHMPLFFLASGFFFKEQAIAAPVDYTKRKVKTLYWLYVKWALIFLILNNVFLRCGLYSEEYYNPDYPAPAYLTLPAFLRHAAFIVFLRTPGSLLLGAYWFIKALFLGSLILCIGSVLIRKIGKKSTEKSILICTACSLLLTCIQVLLPQDIMGLEHPSFLAATFIGCGYFIHHHWAKLLTNGYVAMACLLVLLLLSLFFPSEILNRDFRNLIPMLVGGLAGFFLIYYISDLINKKDGALKSALIYIGDKTFYILTFHFLMFKPASLLKTYIYNMDWHYVAYFPVIEDHNSLYWMAYSATSLVFSLLLASIIERIPILRNR